MSHTAIPAATTALSADIALFWDKLAWYLRMAQSLFGHPAQLAKRLWLDRATHKQFCAFIRPLEEIARRLIFARALELAPMTMPPTPERKVRAHLAMPANAGAAFDMERPETWRVSFRLSAESRSAGAPAGMITSPAKNAGEGAGAPDQISAAPSAARLEALIRAYENRDTLAAKLARQHAREPGEMFAYTRRIDPERAAQTGYNTLNDLIPLIAEAYQVALHKKLDALLPNTS